jgi:hypothetical protein
MDFDLEQIKAKGLSFEQFCELIGLAEESGSLVLNKNNNPIAVLMPLSNLENPSLKITELMSLCEETSKKAHLQGLTEQNLHEILYG